MSDSARKKYTIRDRLDELYRRLAALPNPESADAALSQLCDVLDAVEDEFSGIEKQTPPPVPAVSDGRMYCPLDDHVDRRTDGSILALTRGHRIEIDVDGRLRIKCNVSTPASGCQAVFDGSFG